MAYKLYYRAHGILWQQLSLRNQSRVLQQNTAMMIVSCAKFSTRRMSGGSSLEKENMDRQVFLKACFRITTSQNREAS